MRTIHGLGLLAFGAAAILIVKSLWGQTTGSQPQKEGKAMPKTETMDIILNSAAFKNGETIPRKYTCDGENVSPALSWNKLPDGAREFMLICEDPDAPGGNWVHWVLYGIGSETVSLKENIPAEDTVGNFKQGKNSFGKVGYGGPCPPGGSAHRYFFRLYALGKNLNLLPRASKDEVLRAAEGCIIARGELMGRYGR